LVAAKNLYAWFDAARKTVTVAADVTINPVTTEARICPNPLARILPPPDAREFLVEAAPKSHAPITPPLEVVTRVYFSFSSDATPAKVRVYTMGVDNPAPMDVPVKDQPPPALVGGSTSGGASGSGGTTSREKVEGRGWSTSYSYEEALGAAMHDLMSKLPPGIHPDVSVAAEVIKMTTHFRGNMRPGLEILIKG
jgi:hypothetical protein